MFSHSLIGRLAERERCADQGRRGYSHRRVRKLFQAALTLPCRRSRTLSLSLRKIKFANAELIALAHEIWNRYSLIWNASTYSDKTIGEEVEKVRTQPVEVGCPRDAKHSRLAQHQQLHDKAADPTRGRRNGDRLIRLRCDRVPYDP